MSDRVRYSADAIEIELIRSLYDGLLPSLIMSAGFLVCGTLMVLVIPDSLLVALLVGGGVASAVRIAIARRGAAEVARPGLSIADARQLESRYAASYLAFAAMLGFFGARIFALPAGAAHLLMLCLIIGYAAGVAAGAGLRPRIAIPAMLLAVVPPVLAIAAIADPLYRATAMMTSAFLAGGIFSLNKRHARALDDIGRRLTFAALARRDGLTELPNRLALREWFDHTIRAGDVWSAAPIAVHCLDLNGFKPVNDSFGHPVGDALLAAVAKRLAGAVREGDMVARLGGDEFAIVQRGIAYEDEARLLAQRVVTTIGRPYAIGEREVCISACVGHVLCDDPRRDLEQLLSFADEALYSAKRSGRAVCTYDLGRMHGQAAA